MDALVEMDFGVPERLLKTDINIGEATYFNGNYEVVPISYQFTKMQYCLMVTLKRCGHNLSSCVAGVMASVDVAYVGNKVFNKKRTTKFGLVLRGLLDC